MAEAAVNAPANAADQQAKLAVARETAAEAPLRQQAAQQAADDQTLARLTPALTGPQGASLFGTPAMRSILGPILQRRGMAEYPAEIGAVKDLIAPSTVKPLNQWAQDDIAKALAVPAEARQLPSDDGSALSTYLRSAPVRTPMTGATIQNEFTRLGKQENLLFDAKSGYTPGAFLADISSTIKRFRAAGNTGDAEALAGSYLNADGTGLNEAFVERHVGERYQAEIDKIHKLGIHLDNEDQFKEEREKDLRAQFKQTMTWRTDKLKADEKLAYAKFQQGQQRLVDSQTRLQGYLRSLDLSEQRFQQAQTRDNFQVYKGVVDKANTELVDARKSLASVTAQIQLMSQNPALRDSPLYNDLLTQAGGLKDFIDTQGPILQTRANDAQNQMWRDYSAITPGTLHPTGPLTTDPTKINPPRLGALPPGAQTNPKDPTRYWLKGQFYDVKSGQLSANQQP